MLYVAEVSLDINGTEITDFKSVTEGKVELYKQVQLMNKTGHIKLTPRYAGSLDYMVPEDTAEFDFSTVANGRLTIRYQNGKKVTFTGVYVTGLGDRKIDQENETVQTIEWSAEKRTQE